MERAEIINLFNLSVMYAFGSVHEISTFETGLLAGIKSAPP